MNYNFQTKQDTTTKKLQLQPDSVIQKPVLKLPVQSISLEDVQLTQVDSTRLAPKKKKLIPIVKTVPYVPSNDTIEHPRYNVLTNSFEFPDEDSTHEDLGFQVLSPELSTDYGTGNEVSKKVQEPVSVSQIVEQSSAFKFTKDGGQPGFENTDWMIGVVLVSLLLFSWIRVGYGRFLNAITQAALNYYAAKRLQEEGNILRTRVFNFVNLLFYINISLFTAQILDYYNFSFFERNGLFLFFISLAFWILLFAVKSMVLLLFDFIFHTKRSFRAYLFNIFIYNKVYGLLLMPLVAVIPFVPLNITPWLIGAGVLLFVLLYFMSLIRGLQIAFKNRLSIFYMFLYLCALEILPALMLIKIIKDYLIAG